MKKSILFTFIIAMIIAGCNITGNSEDASPDIQYQVKQLNPPGIVDDSLASPLTITYQTSEGSEEVTIQAGYWNSGSLGNIDRPQIVVVAGEAFYGSVQILDKGLPATEDLIGNAGGNISAETPVLVERGTFKTGVF